VNTKKRKKAVQGSYLITTVMLFGGGLSPQSWGMKNPTHLIGCAVAFVIGSMHCSSAQQSAVVVPEQVAVLVRPILDETQTYRSNGGEPNRASEHFYALTKMRGRFADEALVVVLCFDVMGESQEDTDAVIVRGRKMLPYLVKYRDHSPRIPRRRYQNSLLKSSSQKARDFAGAMKAIQHGWRGTWDNPQG